jgi:hypothetical protein
MRVSSIIIGRDLQLLHLLLGEGGPVPFSETLKVSVMSITSIIIGRDLQLLQLYSWVKVVHCSVLSSGKLPQSLS